MLSVGWTELLIVFSLWLVLFGGWRVLRSFRWQCQWMIHELQGDTDRAGQAESHLGESIAESMKAEMPPDADASRGKIVRDLGNRLTRALAEKQGRVVFQVVCSRQPNAFALPGGLVFVTNALVVFCDQDRDELAFVLAHELAHVQRGHVRERILSSFLLRLLAGLVIGGSWLGRLARRQAGLALTSAYSQDQEFEADSDAARLVRRAGLDPRGGERFFARLEQMSGDACQHRYFASHPPLASRRARLRTLVESSRS